MAPTNFKKKNFFVRLWLQALFQTFEFLCEQRKHTSQADRQLLPWDAVKVGWANPNRLAQGKNRAKGSRKRRCVAQTSPLIPKVTMCVKTLQK